MRVLLLCTVVFGALEAGPLLSFSGAFDSNVTFAGNYIYSDGSCSLSSSYSYQSINYTFSTAGVRTINSYNIDYMGVAKNGVAVNLTDLCNSSVFPLKKGTYSISAIYPFGHWFDANVPYTFILGGSSTNNFVVEVWNGIQGQTALNTAAVGVNKTWMPLTISSEACYQDSTLQLYDTQVVTINASGVYNVFLAFSQNLTLPESVPRGQPRFTIIQGDVSGMDLSTANCTNVMFVTASEDNSNVNAQKFFVSLTGNQTYTFVISSGYFSPDDFYYGHYSLTVSPATRLSFSSIQTWTPPATSSCPTTPGNCQASNRQSLPFGLATFKVVANSYFYVHATEYQTANGSYYGSADLRFFLFAGVNTGPLTCGGLSTCFDTADSFSNQIYTATTNTDYTLIVQDYYDRTLLGSDVSSDLYVMSGLQLGQTAVTNAPTSMSTSAPTSAPNGGGTAAPSSMGGGTAAPSSSMQPTAKGFTYAPSTIAPTPVGYTYAPSSVKPQNATVNSGVRLHPGFLAVALVAFGLM